MSWNNIIPVEYYMEETNSMDEPEPSAVRDALRWRWLVQHASLGFDGAPSWNAVVRLPVFNSDDQTIQALVDRARAALAGAKP